jgi:hypothetical protein
MHVDANKSRACRWAAPLAAGFRRALASTRAADAVQILRPYRPGASRWRRTGSRRTRSPWGENCAGVGGGHVRRRSLSAAVPEVFGGLPLAHCPGLARQPPALFRFLLEDILALLHLRGLIGGDERCIARHANQHHYGSHKDTRRYDAASQKSPQTTCNVFRGLHGNESSLPALR